MEVKQRTARILMHRLTTSTSSTLSEIRLLSKHDPDIRLLFADLGIIPILTNLLPRANQQHSYYNNNNNNNQQADKKDEEEMNIQENACATLLNLSITTPESLMSTGPSLFTSLTASLQSPNNPSLPPLAAATLYSLLTVDAYRPIIGSKLPLITSLITLILTTSSKSPSTTRDRCLKDSLKALFALALYPLNRPTLVSLNAIPPLFSLLVNDSRVGIKEDASAVVAQVAGCYECVDAFRKVGGVRVLVGIIVGNGSAVISERVRENAASGLLNLAMSGGERAVWDIREVEVAEEVVREMAGRGKSERGKRKAEELLRVLESTARGDYGKMVHQFGLEFDGFTNAEEEVSELPRCCSSNNSTTSSVASSLGSSSSF